MTVTAKKEEGRLRRHDRLRLKVKGTKQRPRLSVYRSIKNLFVQVIDDTEGKTLLSVSTLDKDTRAKCKDGGNVKAAEILGELLAKKAQAKGIKKVVLDKGGHLYHGRIKVLSESARKAGLEF